MTMKFARASGTIGLLALTVLASAMARADGAGWYGGLNLGQSRARIDDQGIANGLANDGFTMTSISDKGRASGYKFFGGYQFNRNFALEGGYFSLGKFDFTATTVPAGTLSDNTRINGFNLDALGLLPFTEKFSAFGRLGLNRADVRDSFSGSGLVTVPDPSANKRAMNYKLGVGLQYSFTDALDGRAEVERYRINDAIGNRGDVDLVSLGLVFRFGERGSSGKTQVAMTDVSNSTEAVTPLFVIVPVVPVQTRQYCSILDIQFEIDQDDIQREDKEKLAVLGTFMNKYPDTTAVIEGHSDNVGDADYNMKLSERRADSVVAYLQADQHIAASRLSAVGYGNTRPLVDNSTQDGQRMNRRIDAVIACATDVEGLNVKPARVTMALDLEFDRNKADIRPQYDGELRHVANFLKANPTTTATVEGHTGNLQLSPDLAMQMSQLRAQNVVDYLVNNLGIARSRLTAEGFGQTRQIAYNTSLEGQQENRRVNIIINYAK
jgi:OOP family OmpA-OmpF porin